MKIKKHQVATFRVGRNLSAGAFAAQVSSKIDEQVVEQISAQIRWRVWHQMVWLRSPLGRRK